MESDKVIPLDLLLKRQEKGVATPEQLQTIRAALDSEPTPPGIQDQTTSPGPVGIPPIAYVMHNRTQRCLACNAQHRWSETYALFPAKTHWDKSKVRHLIPLSRLEWNIPIHSQDITESTTPFCGECLDAAQQHVATLPRPPLPGALLKTLAPANAKPANATQSRARTTPTVTIDDLLS